MSPARWNLPEVFAALVAGIALQAIVLPTLSPESDAKTKFAFVLDILVLGRVLTAYFLKETGRGGLFYTVFSLTSAIWIEAIFHFAGK